MKLLHRVRWGLINALARVSPPCCRIAHKISDGRQKPFTLKERFIIRTHLMICEWCTSYSRQIALMSEAGRKEATSVESGHSPALQLSDSAREKLRKALEQRQ